MHHNPSRTALAGGPNSPQILGLYAVYPPTSARRLNQQSVHKNTFHPGPNSTASLSVFAQISQHPRGLPLAAGTPLGSTTPLPSPKSKHRRPFGSFHPGTSKAAEIHPAPGRNFAPTTPRPDEPPLAHSAVAQQEPRLLAAERCPAKSPTSAPCQASKSFPQGNTPRAFPAKKAV